MLKDNNTYLRRIMKAIIIIIFYFIVSMYKYEFSYLLGIDLKKLDVVSLSAYLIIYETLTLAVVIYVYRDELITSFSNFKDNIKEYFSKYFKYWILILLLMFISNAIITNFTTSEVATNQEIILADLKIAPVYILFSTILIAPLLEELIFRFCIKKIIPKPSIIYIIVSGVLFGSMHVILTMENITDLLFIIPYSIPGVVFAYLYNKTDNIFIPAGIHFMHNGILMILQIILFLV